MSTASANEMAGFGAIGGSGAAALGGTAAALGGTPGGAGWLVAPDAVEPGCADTAGGGVGGSAPLHAQAASAHVMSAHVMSGQGAGARNAANEAAKEAERAGSTR